MSASCQLDGGCKKERERIIPEIHSAPLASAQTRPTIRAFMLGAAPHSALPAANMVHDPQYSPLMSKMAYPLPLCMPLVEAVLRQADSSRETTYIGKMTAMAPKGKLVVVPSQPSLFTLPRESRMGG